MNIIQASIPFFFLLIALELGWSRLRAPQAVRLNDAVSDLSLGILSQLSGVFTKFFTIGIYILVEQHLALQRFAPALPAWPEGAPFVGADAFPGFAVRLPALLSWSAVFLLVDLAYYWSHRSAHVINILWAGHVVHHSSEEYNLPVALRQSALHGLMSWVFYIPLAIIGVPWRMFLACNAINLVYQFWIHTRAVGRLGRWTEAVFNTPSHHRVHHGVNPRYQDRNYAGVFIVWDKWFGTFVPEEEEPVYGITTPLRSWNPLWANVHVFVQIARDAWRAHRWRDKLRIVFGHPGWKPPELGESERPREVSAETFEKFDPRIPAPLAWYGFAQFAVTLVAAFLVLQRADSLPLLQSAAAAFYVAIALAGVGGVFEGARWAAVLESARLVVLVGAAGALLATGTLAAA
ncbi:MAG: sterol desaturase family protein, partial [Gemmatimonadota bacterium]|nr:sterol desaturase family protein [Gemmatimonadota bacterium]